MVARHVAKSALRARRRVGVGLRWARKVSSAAALVTDSGGIALTFDDGPHATRTPAILDALAASGSVATFFVLGAEAEKHPGIVRRIVSEGHAVGSHSMSHIDLHKVSTKVAMADIEAGRAAVEQIVGQAVPLFRPPKGHLTVNVGLRLRRGDWRTWLWSVDSLDWKLDATGASVLDATRMAAPGDVIVMHDTVPAAVEGVALVLEHARQAGWNLHTLE